MAGGVPHSNESPSRRATRLALGVALGFVFSQLAAWPAAHLLPVVVVPLLLDARPLRFPEGWKIFGICLVNFFLGGIIAWMLGPWPIILGITCGFMLYRFSLYLLSSGAHLLALISALIGFIVIPVIVVLLPPVGFIAAIGFALDWGFAMIVAWIAWLIMLGGILMKDDIVAASTLIERLWQIVLAAGYVTFSYAVLELFRYWKSRRNAPQPG